MIKSVHDYQIDDVFKKDAGFCYMIPKYQREYTWGQYQWKDLYDDICENDNGYFIGSIICIDNSSDAFQTKELEVVDGQQRLTTLCLLLTAIYNRLKIHKDELDEDDEDELPALRKSIICKGASNGLILCPQIQNHNQADFNVVMYENSLLKSAKREKNWGNRKIAKCYKYFLQRLDQDIEESGDAVKTLLEIKSKVSKAVLVKIEVGSHADVKDAADPTCGSGSLLLRLKNYANVRNYYGQELTSTTYNLARMNMILRGIPYRNFNIYNGDTLEHDYFGDMKFRVQVANPPYSANWSADMHFMEDERFNEYGKLAPKSKADFAFVQHMVYHMDEDGRAVVLLPHGVLFRGAAEEVIRKHLIQKLNVLDAVIGLPANLFFGTGIPVCVLVLKRERNGNSDNILFIDASNDFEAGKNQNILRECDIDKIVETYEHRVDVDKYAHVATMQEIEENGFNLNIPRYVDTFEPEEEIDLNAVAAEIRNIQAEIKGIDAQLKPFFDELGLDFPFDVEGK